MLFGVGRTGWQTAGRVLVRQPCEDPRHVVGAVDVARLDMGVQCGPCRSESSRAGCWTKRAWRAITAGQRTIVDQGRWSAPRLPPPPCFAASCGADFFDDRPNPCEVWHCRMESLIVAKTRNVRCANCIARREGVGELIQMWAAASLSPMWRSRLGKQSSSEPSNKFPKRLGSMTCSMTSFSGS